MSDTKSLIAFAFASAMLCCIAGCTDGASAIPNLSGTWAREFIGFDPPSSGPGPLANRFYLPTGQSDLNRIVGDYTSAVLKPAAAEAVKQRGEIVLGNRVAPDAFNQCAPQQVPFMFYQQQIQLLQKEHEVLILYMFDHHFRRVRLNAEHPSSLAPSWSGDSVGRYEGDSLVIDTVGMKVGEFSMLDMFGTPQSEALHVVERYRLIDYEAAIETEKQSEKRHIHLMPDGILNDGVAIDPEYRGQALHLEFTVEDPAHLNGPWSATSVFRRALNGWQERVCAENTFEFGGRKLPTSNMPDF